MKRLTILISTLLFLPFQIANAQVGQAYYVQVSNPTALIQALDTLNDTQAGRSDNIDVRLEVSVSNGTSAATHNIVVNGAAASDMDASRRVNATSQDWADFISIVQDVAAPVAELVYVFMDVDNGKESIVTSPNSYNNYVHLQVSDVATYMDALEDLMAADTRNVYMHAYQVFGTGPNGANLTVVLSANTLEDLLAPTTGYEEFLQKTKDIRTPVSNGIYQVIKAWE